VDRSKMPPIVEAPARPTPGNNFIPTTTLTLNV
jgi:hypothetical protein